MVDDDDNKDFDGRERGGYDDDDYGIRIYWRKMLFSINFIVWKFILLIASIKITLKSHMRKQSFWLFTSFHLIECLDSIASVLCSATDIENAFNWEKLKEFPLKSTLFWWICTWQVRLAIQLIQFGSIQFKRLKF